MSVREIGWGGTSVKKYQVSEDELNVNRNLTQNKRV